jgi:hypothetical protein
VVERREGARAFAAAVATIFGLFMSPVGRILGEMQGDVGSEGTMALTQNDPGPARNERWLRQLKESRSEWRSQRAVMEAQLGGFETRLTVTGSRETRALLAVVVAQSRAIRALLAARSAAADDLLEARDALKDFSRISGRRSADALGIRLRDVTGALLEAQEEALETLLAAQTEAAHFLQ